MDFAIREKVICACAAIFSLGGCAPAVYKPDVAGKPTARIRMVSNFLGRVVPMRFDGPCFPFSESQGELMPILDQEKRETIGIPMTNLPSSARFMEHNIVAEAPTIFQFRTSWQSGAFLAPKMECASRIGFTPQKGADYEAKFSYRATPEGCTLSLRRLRLGSDGRVVEEVVPDAKVPTCGLH